VEAESINDADNFTSLIFRRYVMMHELAKKDYPRTAVYNVSVEIPLRAMPGESTATVNPKPPPPDRPGRH
jgi:hypothetical protein